MKRFRITSAFLVLLILASLVPAALAADVGRPGYAQEFIQGKTKKVVALGGGVLVLKEDGTVWANGNVPYHPNKATTDTGDGVFTTFQKIFEGAADIEADTDCMAVITQTGDLWVTERNVWADGQTRAALDGSFHKVLSDVTQVALGGGGLAIKRDGTLWGWGTEIVIQCPIRIENVPPQYVREDPWGPRIVVPVKMMENVKKVQCTRNAALFLKTDGMLYSVGLKQSGETGWAPAQAQAKNPITDESWADQWLREPVRIMENVTDIKAEDKQAYAFKEDGSLWGWGQLSFNPNVTQFSPRKIAMDVKDCAATMYGLMMVKANGEVWTLGGDCYGEACLGSVAFRDYIHSTSVPHSFMEKYAKEQKGLMDEVVSIASGGFRSYFIKRDGSLWGLGESNPTGQSNVLSLPQWMTFTLEPLQLAGPQSTPLRDSVSAQHLAQPSYYSITVGDKNTSVGAYIVKGEVYLKLRDVAMALQGSRWQFDVTWNQSAKAVSLTSSHPYTVVGGELATIAYTPYPATGCTALTFIDGVKTNLHGYTIQGSNYFRLEDFSKIGSVKKTVLMPSREKT